MQFILVVLALAPKSNACWKHTEDVPHPLPFRVHGRMTQKSPNVFCNIVFVNVQKDQTVLGMGQTTTIEIPIERKESRPIELQQQRDDVVIRQAFSPDIDTNLSNVNAPISEQLLLTLRHVFIQHIHARTASCS